MPGRDRSRVRIASPKPSPSAPIRFATGTRTLSNASSAVGEPRIPILCSSRLTEKPALAVSTTKAEIRWWRSASGSVTAKTVTRLATLPWLMKRFVAGDPVARPRRGPPGCGWPRRRSRPRPRSARTRSGRCPRRAPARTGRAAPPCRRGGAAAQPSSWTARMSPVVAQAAESASIARQTVSRSPPRPPKRSGNGSPRIPCSASRLRRSSGNVSVRSISAARGATRSRAIVRTASRIARWSSVSRPWAAGAVTLRS